MKLTNENIKAALDVLGDISYQEFVVLDRERRQALNTCIKALDACRWRDAETELPETNATVLVRWQAKNGVRGYKFSYYENGI